MIHSRTPVPIRVAAVLLGFTVLLAVAAAVQGHAPGYAWVLAATATAGLVSVTARRTTAVLLGVTATVIACGCWTIAEVRSRHIVFPYAGLAVAYAVLLLVRPDSREYLNGPQRLTASGRPRPRDRKEAPGSWRQR